jgi:glycosyltransferase involved in cell wall biosynthesis
VERASATAFDLIVSTVDRSEELEALLRSLAGQTHREFRVLVVDQNADDRLDPILAAHPELGVIHLRSPRGLNRARNVGLAAATAPLVAFPDDDCVYPPDLLERVARAFGEAPALGGLTGRTAEPSGETSEKWPDRTRRLDLRNVWHGGNSASLFLRRDLVERLGRFDERLGFGGSGSWELGDETDLLVRALLAGAEIVQDPGVVVWHEVRRLDRSGARLFARRSGAGVGFILGKNRVPAAILARRFLRPAGGVLVGLLRFRPEEARLALTTLVWRARGYRAGRRARERSSSKS